MRPTKAVSKVSQTGPDGDLLPLVSLYFRLIDQKPHSLFHEPSFRASIAAGTASRTVLICMMAMCARFSTQPDVRARGPIYIAEAKAALKSDIENICIENLQACILVGNICAGDCDSNAESLYFALATRMAHILKVWDVNDGDDGVTREIKRRIWWTCFIIDTWGSGGIGLSRQFGWRPKMPNVPMDEAVFSAMRPGDPDIGSLEWKPGLWGHMVRLVEIYGQIQDFLRHLAESDDWDEDAISDTVRDLDTQMADFELNIGPDLAFSTHNLSRYVSHGLGSVFIAFHLGFHHYKTLLFYIYLDSRRSSVTNGKAYARRCKHHATTVCEVLKASRDHPGAEALYNIVGHVTIVSSSVLLHTYLFGEADELPHSRRCLESNLETLVQLRGYWANIDLMIKRLVIFQNNCMRSLNEDTYRFDRWMVKFLIAHSLTLEDKGEQVRFSIPAYAVGRRDGGNTHLERGRVTQGIIMGIQGLDGLE
ncbi:hypothetical protein SPBR_01542 [Sporothrix brasiliensis 5110]|uniref:Xylanolytic transcriptional activator regulatory domain-containing protein n=1 Tax=Sporothrix brasiliensis 5110 TaxID=1398154 RepID=A0A0C2IQA9_9PEZI|nr:uncharacterized protein SPBR_01542 [Sporothrix brasiliensis 5110]KIH91221.1 hypothetical protein SPBR_01542 [Sporothrix brasiliensis 5110]